VCLLPGTEIAFEDGVEYSRKFSILPNVKLHERVARFRLINLSEPDVHHDALEFPSGQIVLVTRLCEGQHATVLQLPAPSFAAKETTKQTEELMVNYETDCEKL
jgi:hypothetical protein